MPRLFRALLACLALGCLWAGPAPAAEPLVSAMALPGKTAYAAGGKHLMGIQLNVAKPYHINSHQPDDPDMIPTALRIRAAKGITFGPPSYPPAEKLKFKFSPKPIAVYHGRVVLLATFQLDKGLAPGRHPARAVISYQACDDQSCLLPDEVSFNFTINVAGKNGPPINQRLLTR